MKTNRLVLLVLLVVAMPAAAEPLANYPAPEVVKADFLKLLDRPRVAPEVRMIETGKEEGGLITEHFQFVSEKKPDGSLERVPVLLIRPDRPGKKLPAVIVLHGTGGNKEAMRPWLVDLARRGIIGVAIDARYHAERVGVQRGSEAYNQACIRAWRARAGEPQEHPFFYDTCWDLWRTVDYLQTRADIDPERIGMIGFSMGGIQTWLAAAVDERVKVAVPAIAAQSFRWSLENDRWQGRARTIRTAHEAAAKDLGEAEVNAKVCRALWNKIIPGITDKFDCPSMIRLFAGRPLLLLSGELDGNCPIEGARLAFAAAEKAYKDRKAEDRLKIMVARGVGHAVPPEHRQAALDWLVRWLEP